jgi:hypothetical protein
VTIDATATGVLIESDQAIGGTITINSTTSCVRSSETWFGAGCPGVLGSALSTVTLGVPTGTTSGTPVMMGLGASCKITPQSTGRVDFRIRGTFGNSVANITGIVGFRFDTGTGPANGVAATGTSAGETP